ncbi:hypothetical protein BGX23_003342 [Mortierella sp. AD031]|nr:hypothetical protein BGX23_003342 [Mortierella sp. AD031]KAG0204112.1 hypothetical protein BGX33_008695 [Mortierella sp. NVP41]
MTIKTNSDTLSPVIIQPIPETLKAPVEEEREEREQIMDQIPGYEPELLWRPRSHYKNFWRASTTSTTSTSTTATTDNRSSSSEEESPLHLNRGRAAAVASGSTTLTTSCMSETTSTHAAAKRLLAMRVRDSFLVPKGTSLLDQALSRAETHLPEPIVPSPPAEETVKAASTMAKLELGTMKTLAKPTTILSGPSLSPPAEKSGAEPSITEQPRIDHIPPKPISSERVFIFVDNSNILHGFYHCRQQQSEARGTAVASKDRTSIRTKPVDLQERDRASPQDKYPATLQEGTPPVMNLETMENGMALATPTTNDNGPKPFSAAMVKADGGSGGGPKAKMAKGSHLLPKFNYTKFFELLKRDRSAARQVLVGSSPLFQELDEAMEHLYETFILRRVKKFVQGELGVVPVPVKQLRYPSNYNNSNNNTAVVVEHGLYDTTETLFDKPSTSLAPVTSAAPTINTGGARGEQGVDELLHLKMLETILDHEPATMVLATGDGGDSEFGGGGFYGVIKRALDRGWHVEVVSWEDQLSGVYLELALEYGYSCEHKLAKSTGGSSGKRCHAPTEDVRVPGQQPQQKHRPLGSKKQRAKAQAQAQAQAQMQAQENKRGGHGHLRVWCLDWYGDILLQPTPSCTV